MFVDTVTTSGIPNLSQVAPRLWRSGQLPSDPIAWQDLAARIAPNREQVLIVKLDDETEGSDTPAEALGWTVLHAPIPPEDDQPWTVLVKPSPKDVMRAVAAIEEADTAGKVVLWHCVHGRDRTGLVTGILRIRMFGWSKRQAWDEMIAHGFRWELPDLDAFWIENVP